MFMSKMGTLTSLTLRKYLYLLSYANGVRSYWLDRLRENFWVWLSLFLLLVPLARWLSWVRQKFIFWRSIQKFGVMVLHHASSRHVRNRPSHLDTPKWFFQLNKR